MVHQPTLKQLKYLCAVAEHLHFGNAAQACYVSQSTLSAGILELEENLGVPLIERNNKKVLITAIGRDIINRSQRVLTEVDDLVAAAGASQLPFTGEMRLGVIPTIAPFLLPKPLKKLRKEYPKFKFFIREDLSGHLVHALALGELDVLLLALPFPAENTETKHLFYDEFLLAYEQSHSFGKSAKVRTRDLQGQDLLLLEDGHCLRDHVLEACKISISEISIPYQATSLNTIVQMVANNIGVTLIPQMAVDRKILSGTPVKTKPFAEKNVHRSIGLMWRKKSPRFEEFEMLGDFICAVNSGT